MTNSDDGATDSPALPLALRNLAVAAYLAVQLLLPLNGLLHDKTETRGDFSWNMYSQDYSCSRRYVLLTPDGRGELLDLDAYFATDIGSQRVCHADRLGRFHDWLCAELEQRGRAGVLKAGIEARLNYGDDVTLLERYADLCLVEAAP